MLRNWDRYSLCQTLRETYRMTTDENIRLNLRIAMSMAKAMDRKLKEYNADWANDFWEKKEISSRQKIVMAEDV